MAQRPSDWHREEIKAAIRKSGITLVGLSVAKGLPKSACSYALIRPWPRVQAIMAAHLGVKPQDIWPSRYDAAGDPLPHRQITVPPTRAHRQKCGGR